MSVPETDCLMILRFYFADGRRKEIPDQQTFQFPAEPFFQFQFPLGSFGILPENAGVSFENCLSRGFREQAAAVRFRVVQCLFYDLFQNAFPEKTVFRAKLYQQFAVFLINQAGSGVAGQQGHGSQLPQCRGDSVGFKQICRRIVAGERRTDKAHFTEGFSGKSRDIPGVADFVRVFRAESGVCEQQP